MTPTLRVSMSSLSGWSGPDGCALELVGERLELRATRHGLDELLAGHRPPLELVGHPPSVEQVEPVTDHVRVVRVVGDEHDRDPALTRLEDVLQDDTGLPHAQRAGRL